MSADVRLVVLIGLLMGLKGTPIVPLEPGTFLRAPLLIKRRLFITFHRKNIKYVRKSHNWPLEILQERKKHVFLFVIKITILYGIDLHAKHVIRRADVHDITDRSTGLRYVPGQHRPCRKL